MKKMKQMPKMPSKRDMPMKNHSKELERVMKECNKGMKGK